MATKRAISKTTIAENGSGSTAPEKRELTKAEHLQKANRLMEQAWDKIYNRKNKEGETS